MSAPWQHVHLRLSTTLPVRTHVRPEIPPPAYRTPPKRSEVTLERRRQIRAWLAEETPPSWNEMARRLRISKPAVHEHIKVIKAEANPTD